MKDADVDMSDVDLEFDNNGYDLAMAEFVDEANLKNSHPTNYVAEHKECMQARLEKPIPKKKAKKAPVEEAKDAASPEAGMFEVLVNLDEPFSHHLNDASFLAMQENTTSMCDEIVSMFIRHCEDEYSVKVSENNLSETVESFDSQLQLRATSYAIVNTIQQTSVNCMLRVLFDSGSNKTLIKQLSLPPGITPSIGKKRKVIRVTLSLDWEVFIENMTLPEFSSTQCVSGPLRVFVMNITSPIMISSLGWT
jgi:hypothetical protein